VNITGIIDSAKAGLQVAQAGMLATSQNVTGSSVDGYVRRTADVRVAGLAASSIDLTGTSFAVEGFGRNYSALLQKQLLTQIGRTAYTNELTRAAAGIDSMLINPDTSIASALGSFFNAAGSLASDPNNIAFQQSLIGTAKQVVVRVRTLAEAVASLESDAKQGMADVLNAANTSASQLADVNARIQAAQVPGLSYPSPDLLDQRDRLAAKLQSLVGGTSLLNEDGTASHQVGGLSLVDRTLANRFVNGNGGSPVNAQRVPDSIALEVKSGLGGAQRLVSLTQPSVAGGSGAAAFTMVFSDGKAGAYAQLLSDFVPSMKTGLNLFSATLVTEVNDILGTADGALFRFEAPTPLVGPISIGGTATTIANFTGLLDGTDPNGPSFNANQYSDLIADGLSALSLGVGVSGSNTTWLSGITALRAQNLEALRDGFIAPMTSLTTRPATVIAGWSQDNQMNETLQQSLKDQKNSISGVNLDEEAANLVKYQQLYNASSKLIQTGQQMFDMLLSMLSGR
jgi:flagellar hook-associated protein 1 FlgK